MERVTLYQSAGRPWGMPNLSPFCGKLETYLRMAEVPYDTAVADIRKAPKGKVPYVAIDGGLMGDSQLVIDRLERQAGERALDHGLAPRDRAIAHALRRMLEDGLYFVSMYNRWATDDGFAVLAPEFRKILPGPVKLAMPLIRRTVKKALRAQGTGRHAPDEVMAMGIADLDAASELLGDRPFVCGDRPRTVDASLFAFATSILGFPAESRLRSHAEGLGNLVAYRDRIRARWWPELVA